MSCNTNCYLPNPPRAWSRVQHSCSLLDQNTYNGDALVPLPYSGKLVPISSLYLEFAMLSKGNVLQYKKNSSNLTKQQRYSQIAKGKWTNRTTTWATQSTRGYTNPNNQHLQRVGATNITLDGTPTLEPVTCPITSIITNNALPATSTGGSGNPETIPPPPPPPTGDSGTALPATATEPAIKPIVIQDQGNLVCGTFENICTGQLIRQPTDSICHPTSDSDVPGPIMYLCWNDGNPTWYPRQQYTMNNSGNKWPTNAILRSAVVPLAPVIISVTNENATVTLTWTQDESCIQVTDFTIYEDGIPIKMVSGTILTTDIAVDNCATYTFYIVGSNQNIESDPSNTVSIDIFVLAPTITTIDNTCNSDITIYWEFPTISCYDFSFNTIYQNDLPVATITDFATTSYTIASLNCSTYSYYIITTYTNGIISPKSNTVTIDKVPCTPTNLLVTSPDCTTGITTLSWTAPQPTCSALVSYNIYNNSISIGNTGNTSTTYSIPVGTLTCGSNTFYVTAVFSTIESQPSNSVSINLAPCSPAIVLDSVSSTTATISWTIPSQKCIIISYNIYKNSIYLANTVNLNYTATGLTSGQSYTFYVTSVGSNTTESGQSNTVTAVPDYSTPVINPVTPTGPGTATVSWTNGDIPIYYLFTLTTNSGTTTIISTIVSSATYSYNCTGLISGTVYTVNVVAVYINPNSNKSAVPVTFTQP